MLISETYFADHLEALVDKDGHVFSLSRKHMEEKGLLAFESEVVNEILDGDYEHTLILIETPSARHRQLLGVVLGRIGKKVDDVKKHRIHIFYIQPDMFEPLDAELRSLEV